MKPTKLTVKTKSETYPIIIGSNLIKDLLKYLIKSSINFDQCLLLIDKKVPGRMITKITKSLKRKKISKFIFNANEKNKNQLYINKILLCVYLRIIKIVVCCKNLILWIPRCSPQYF